MAQVWSVIGFLATSLAAMVAMMYRSMSIHGRQMTDALNNGLSGLRNEMKTEISGLRDGLRNEMIARFEKVDQRFNHVDQRFDHVEARLAKVEAIDREVHALSLKVFGQEGPPKAP